jgi:ribosomal protein L37E
MAAQTGAQYRPRRSLVSFRGCTRGRAHTRVLVPRPTSVCGSGPTPSMGIRWMMWRGRCRRCGSHEDGVGRVIERTSNVGYGKE